MEHALHDHRKLGRELELFDTDPLFGAGLPYWRPAGAAVRHELEEYVRELERKAGYQHVYSPVLGKRELFEISGHSEHYRDGMYPPMTIRSGGSAEQVVLRPSLCPHHAVIYASRAHSYRELPLRLAELGGMYRAELSGVLGGLTRVRSIQLNDAHIFCTLDQVQAEAAAAVALIREAYRALGIEPARFRLSLAGPSAKYAGSRDSWDRAEAILRAVLDEAGLPYQAEEGEAAFYGPKIDVQVADSAERETSLSTVQVDFYQPERFGLEYVGPDGGRHRPVMVHRSIIGGLERMMAHLIDVHGGAFPPWLAPVQLVALPVSDAQRAPGRGDRPCRHRSGPAGRGRRRRQPRQPASAATAWCPTRRSSARPRRRPATPPSGCAPAASCRRWRRGRRSAGSALMSPRAVQGSGSLN